MSIQEETAGQIEKIATQCTKNGDNHFQKVDFYFQKLTKETHIAIDLLKKELVNY